MLAEVVEKLKNTGLQAAPPAHCYTGPGDVTCDVCTGRKRKAVKSCLVCLASYCETHLKFHNELNPGKRHKLIDASGNLQEKICSHHDKLLEIYCRTDQQCICYLCTMDKHRGHDTISAAAERTEKQKQLGETQKKSQQRIQEIEKELQDLRQAVDSLMRSAQAAVEDSERIFTELIRSIERRRSEVKELIRDQEKAAVSRAEGHQEQLEQEIAELRRRDAELEQLSPTEDHIHFLQSCESLCAPPGPVPSITVNLHVSFETATKFVSELKERLEDVCKGEMVKISKACSLCMASFQKKQRLICSHELCVDCLKRSVERSDLQCPVCHKALRVLGDQPEGTMTINHSTNGCCIICYNIPNGIQTEAHPNPGMSFTGIHTNTFLPNTPEGIGVLQLLRRAFDQRLVFTVAATNGAKDRVIFTDIPQSTTWDIFDHGFLEKVKAALRAKGIE
ncbi:hypothetical protein AAFF_G00124480 [Aldrovandia affinis]|uniref:RING-type E3 ubiquitin transferase n=1 Tax=Aldrovandia affinis TaxID=143900 RepID=A0AAD7W9M9_9TELE|nr:hypothetical protein AAFF_G00124480 [Aldrovandia affinis]